MSTSPESKDWMVLQCRSCGTRMKTSREAAQNSRLLCPKCRQPVLPKREVPEETMPVPPPARKEEARPEPGEEREVEAGDPSPVSAAAESTIPPGPLGKGGADDFSPSPLPPRQASAAAGKVPPATGSGRNASSFQGGVSMRGGGSFTAHGEAVPQEASRHPSFDGFLPAEPAPAEEEREEDSGARMEAQGPQRLRRDSRRKRIERGRRVLDYDELADWDSTDLSSMPTAEAEADIWDQPRDAAPNAYDSDEREFIVEDTDEHGNKIRKRKKIRRNRTARGMRLVFQRLTAGSKYVVIGLAVLTVVAGLYGIYVLQQKATDPDPGLPPEVVEIDRSVMTSADFEATMGVVRNFLAADGVEAKLRYVRQPGRVRPLMERWYREDHSAAPTKCGEPVWVDKIEDRKSYFVMLSAPVTSPDPLAPGSTIETPTYFAVEEIRKDSGSEYLLDWEVSTGYQDMPLETFMSTMPKEPHIFRVKIREGGYYNHDFTEDRWLCAEIYYPGRDFSLVGYIDRASPGGRDILPYATGDARTSLILELSYPDNAVSRNQVVINKLVHPSWFFGSEEEAEKALTP